MKIDNTQTAMIALEEALKSTLTEAQLTCYSLLRKEWEKQINSREDMIRDLKSELRQTQNDLADARW
jgi:hypothetical protein